MPHIKIQMYAGRPEEIKQKLVDTLTADISKALGVEEWSISVAIEEVNKEDWVEQVYDKYIVPDKDILYKKPGYGSLNEKNIT